MELGRVEKVLVGMSIAIMLVCVVLAATTRAAADQVVVLKTLGMTCGSCAGKIEQALLAKPGVDEVKVDVEGARVIVIYDSKETQAETLAGVVTATGFRSGVVQNLSMEQYRKMSGQHGTEQNQPQKSGCGSKCC